MVDAWTMIISIVVAAAIVAVVMIAWGNELNRLRRLIVPRKVNLPQNTGETTQ